MNALGRRVLGQGPVRPVAVVVIGILGQDQPRVPFPGDRHPVQALAASTVPVGATEIELFPSPAEAARRAVTGEPG